MVARSLDCVRIPSAAEVSTVAGEGEAGGGAVVVWTVVVAVEVVCAEEETEAAAGVVVLEAGGELTALSPPTDGLLRVVFSIFFVSDALSSLLTDVSLSEAVSVDESEFFSELSSEFLDSDIEFTFDSSLFSVLALIEDSEVISGIVSFSIIDALSISYTLPMLGTVLTDMSGLSFTVLQPHKATDRATKTAVSFLFFKLSPL